MPADWNFATSMSGSTTKLHWASEATSKSPRRSTETMAAASTTSCFTLSPICRHWSMSQMPTGLSQETPRFRPRLLDVSPVARQLLQLRRRRRPRRAGDLDPSHLAHHGDAREILRGFPAIEGQGERAPHPPVFERLALVVDGDQGEAVPRALLNGDLGAEGLHEAVPFGRSEAAELRVRPLTADGRHLCGRGGDEDCAIAVEVGLALIPVVGVLLAH